MNKSKMARVAGFVGVLGASATLVGFAASGTGAYFTDSHGGEIDASTGHVRVNVAPADLKLSFENLLPGEYKTQHVNYSADGTAPEDIWLVFGNDSEAFTGKPDDSLGGGLGRYGHFELASSGGAHFSSYNLSNPGTTAGHTGSSCSVDGNGWGGSNQQATDKSDSSVPFCAPSNAILLDSNMAPGTGGSADLTFGFTPLLTGPQDAPLNKVVSFKIVATQHGVRPDNVNNPAS